MMPTNINEARLLREARNVLAHVPIHVVWRRTFAPYQANFGQRVRLELTRDLQLRVIEPRSGEVLASGPALAQKSE